jgi:hypothetical protein
MEGMALVEQGRRRWIFVTPSLSLKARKKAKGLKKSKRGKLAPARNGLVRISLGRHGRLDAEVMPAFREWLLTHDRRLRKAARFLPDDGGLNVEALGWDPPRGALTFGIRTPVPKRGPMIARVRVRELGGPWTTENLEYLEPVFLKVPDVGDEQGVRSLEYVESLGGSVVVTGNSTSASKAPFRMHLWDGNDEGRTTPFPAVRFAKRMKPEGVTAGTVAGRPAVVFVDDGGGYAVVFEDDPRLVR